LPARIAAKIGREITEGRIAPGEKLPTEHLLATTFGVSRSVVREAIAQLRNEGLVETRQGVGAFATEIERRQSLRIEQGDLANREVSVISFSSAFRLRWRRLDLRRSIIHRRNWARSTRRCSR
jgi:GntR family transcriptional repressor for pyruvate dehydrogenase complex